MVATLATGPGDIRKHFETQAAFCAQLGSPYYGFLLRECGIRLDESSAVGDAVLHWRGDPLADALALRFAAALRYLVLSGLAPASLLQLQPSAQGAMADADWEMITELLLEHESKVLSFIENPVQTNEVRRSVVLLGGFLYAAARFELPLVLYEIGASAGLNALWDGYHYTAGDWSWGYKDAGVTIESDFEGTRPPSANVEVAERRACDRSPLRLNDVDDRNRLLSYIWPDQRERIARTTAAIANFLASDVMVEQRDAYEWLEEVLATQKKGATRVVYHSIMMQYLAPTHRRDIATLITEHGERASHDSPLVWLRYEPAAHLKNAELTAVSWPGGETTTLAEACFHGSWVRWSSSR